MLLGRSLCPSWDTWWKGGKLLCLAVFQNYYVIEFSERVGEKGMGSVQRAPFARSIGFSLAKILLLAPHSDNTILDPGWGGDTGCIIIM